MTGSRTGEGDYREHVRLLVRGGLQYMSTPRQVQVGKEMVSVCESRAALPQEEPVIADGPDHAGIAPGTDHPSRRNETDASQCALFLRLVGIILRIDQGHATSTGRETANSFEWAFKS